MNYKLLGKQNDIVFIENCEKITNGQTALDIVMTTQYDTGHRKLILPKSAFAEEFFILSTGLAGEVIQKFVNYRLQVAIVGDYSKYTSEPLKDFIFESNNGNSIFFVATEEQAIKKLENAN